MAISPVMGEIVAQMYVRGLLLLSTAAHLIMGVVSP